MAKVLEIESTEQTLFVRAGVGWGEGVVGHARLPMGERSSETYSVEKGVPVITPDIRTDDRFDFPEFMVQAGVCGAVNVPIFLPGGKRYGLLQVDSRKIWQSDEQTIEFLRTYSTILGPVIDRLHKIHALERAEKRNETLLRELQHRIKNNIGAITGLVHMRLRKARSEEVRDELRVVAERIEDLRLVHELVYAAKGTDRLPLRSYVTQLLAGVLALHEDLPVRLDADIDDVEVSTDTAIPLGLILNEFATNSLKHAFRDGNGCLAVEARQWEDQLRVKISDNGKGLPAEESASRPGILRFVHLPHADALRAMSGKIRAGQTSLAKAADRRDDRLLTQGGVANTMSRFGWLSLMAGALAASSAAQAQQRFYIIDMHFHADLPDAEGPPGGRICAPYPKWPPRDPGRPIADYLKRFSVHPECSHPLIAPTDAATLRDKGIAALRRYNILALADGTAATIEDYRVRTPERILPAAGFGSDGTLPSIAELRRLHAAGKLAA